MIFDSKCLSGIMVSGFMLKSGAKRFCPTTEDRKLRAKAEASRSGAKNGSRTMEVSQNKPYKIRKWDPYNLLLIAMFPYLQKLLGQ